MRINRAALVGVLGALIVGMLVAPPVRAAGPNVPPDMTEVTVTSGDFDGHVAIPSSTLSVDMRWILCGGAGGLCNPSIPTSYELQVGVASACAAASCTWTSGPMVLTDVINPADARAGHGFWTATTPALNVLLPGVDLTAKTIGVTARVHNATGWSTRLSDTLLMAVPVANDHVPTNVTLPSVGSYSSHGEQSLVVGAWIAAWTGTWASGASSATRMRAQFVKCATAACPAQEATFAVSAAQGLQCDATVPSGFAVSPSTLCYVGVDIADTDVGFRVRVMAQNLAGWSAWAYSPIALVHPPAPANPVVCVACKLPGIVIDLSGLAPIAPNADPAALAKPAAVKAPVFTAANNPAGPVAANGSVAAGTELGAVGTTWRLPAGWTSPDIRANTAFTLYACASADQATCHSAGSWPADGLVGGTPRLGTMGAVSPGTPFMRVAQTTDLVNASGVSQSFTALSDGVAVTPAANGTSTPSANGGTPAQNGGSTTPSTPAATGTIDVAASLAAAGVDQGVSPLGGTDGAGTVGGLTMTIKVAPVEKHGVHYKVRAIIRPRTKGKVRFTLTRTGPHGNVAVGKTRTAKVKKGKATSGWIFDAAKPSGPYLVIASFRPKKAGTTGITVTKTITLQ